MNQTDVLFPHLMVWRNNSQEGLIFKTTLNWCNWITCRSSIRFKIMDIVFFTTSKKVLLALYEKNYAMHNTGNFFCIDLCKLNCLHFFGYCCRT